MNSKNFQIPKSRREFIRNSALAATAFTVVPRYVPGDKGFTAPANKLNIACVGIGGKGRVDVQEVSHENIVALCDVAQVTYYHGDHMRIGKHHFTKLKDRQVDYDKIVFVLLPGLKPVQKNQFGHLSINT